MYYSFLQLKLRHPNKHCSLGSTVESVQLYLYLIASHSDKNNLLVIEIMIESRECKNALKLHRKFQFTLTYCQEKHHDERTPIPLPKQRILDSSFTANRLHHCHINGHFDQLWVYLFFRMTQSVFPRGILKFVWGFNCGGKMKTLKWIEMVVLMSECNFEAKLQSKSKLTQGEEGNLLLIHGIRIRNFWLAYSLLICIVIVVVFL